MAPVNFADSGGFNTVFGDEGCTRPTFWRYSCGQRVTSVRSLVFLRLRTCRATPFVALVHSSVISFIEPLPQPRARSRGSELSYGSLHLSPLQSFLSVRGRGSRLPLPPISASRASAPVCCARRWVCASHEGARCG